MKKNQRSYQELEQELSVVKEKLNSLQLAEQSAKIREARLRAMNANIGDVIGIMRSDGILNYISPNVELRLGWKPEDLIGTDMWQVIHPEDVERVKKAFFSLYEHDKASVTQEYRVKGKDGRFFWIKEKAVNSITDSAINGIIFSFHDITDRKNAELALRESEANLKSLINNQDESIWSIDRNYNYIIFNKYFKGAYYRTFGVELKKNMNALSILTPELKEFWKPKYERALRGERVVFEFSRHVDGKLKYFKVWLNSIVSDGEITGVSGLSVDITERKEAEKVLLESRANLHAIIENTTDSIWAINPSYEILYANAIFESAFFRSFGVHLKPGTNLLMSLPEPIRPQWKARYDRALNNEHFEFIDEIDLGVTSIFIEVLMNPIVIDNEVIGASFFGRDITERMKAEKTHRENEARLDELNATKDKFFSIIAHDLKSPFNNILGLTNLLMNQIKRKDYDEIETLTDMIQNASQNALNLLKNLLEWALSQSGRLDFNPEEFELPTLVDEVIKMSENLVREKSISISTKLQGKVSVYADKAMLSTILRNLVSNAIKFTKTSGKIVISAEQQNDKVVVSVKDTGVGIEKEAMDKLFRIDKSISTLGTQNEKGTGLGLIICREFIQKHGGTIWVESKYGKGSTFSFSIPSKK